MTSVWDDMMMTKFNCKDRWQVHKMTRWWLNLLVKTDDECMRWQDDEIRSKPAYNE